MTDKTELLPCPSCEGEVVAVGKLAHPSHPATPYQASCGTCGASGSEASTGELAVEVWNRLARRQQFAESAKSSAEPVAWRDVGYLMSIIDDAIKDGFDPDEDGPLLDEIRAGLTASPSPASTQVGVTREEGDTAAHTFVDIVLHLQEMVNVVEALLRCDYDGNGLTDCVDNTGKAYQSADLEAQIKRAETAIADYRAAFPSAALQHQES